MKCFTSREKQLAKKAASLMMDAQAEDICARAQGIVYAAMLNAGLSPNTVNRVIRELPHVVQQYGKYRQDGLADYEMFTALQSKGVNVSPPRSEL